MLEQLRRAAHFVYTYSSIFFVFLAVFSVSVAQTVTISPVGDVTAVEGTVFNITCTHTDGTTSGVGIILHQNGAQLVGDNTPPNEVTGATRVFHVSVDRAESGSTYNCASALNPGMSPVITLTVTCEWNGYWYVSQCALCH